MSQCHFTTDYLAEGILRRPDPLGPWGNMGIFGGASNECCRRCYSCKSIIFMPSLMLGGPANELQTCKPASSSLWWFFLPSSLHRAREEMLLQQIPLVRSADVKSSRIKGMNLYVDLQQVKMSSKRAHGYFKLLTHTIVMWNFRYTSADSYLLKISWITRWRSTCGMSNSWEVNQMRLSVI